MSWTVFGDRISSPILEHSFAPGKTQTGFRLRSSEFAVWTHFLCWEFVRFESWILERPVVVAVDAVGYVGSERMVVVVAAMLSVVPLPLHRLLDA